MFLLFEAVTVKVGLKIFPWEVLTFIRSVGEQLSRPCSVRHRAACTGNQDTECTVTKKRDVSLQRMLPEARNPALEGGGSAL